MFEKEYEASAHGAAAKVRFLEENPLGYVMVSLLGGAYLGFGVLLTYAIESYLGPQPSVHIIMGLSFGVALSLVIIAGAEMFTGDAFILYNGLRRKTVTAGDVVKLLVVCYLGNWLGALILSVIFYGTGLDTGAMAQALTEAAALRMNLPPLEIFCRLNVKHGPNVEQMVRELPLGAEEVMAEFDLAYTQMNERRLDKIWLDLIFESPAMSAVELRELFLSRHLRAEV